MTPECSYPDYRCVSTSTPTAQGHGAVLTVPPPPSVGRTTGERANERTMHADSDGPCEFPMLSPFIHAVPYVRSAVGRERPACSFNNTSVLCPCVDEHRAPERRGVLTPTPKALAQGGVWAGVQTVPPPPPSGRDDDGHDMARATHELPAIFSVLLKSLSGVTHRVDVIICARAPGR